MAMILSVKQAFTQYGDHFVPDPEPLLHKDISQLWRKFNLITFTILLVTAPLFIIAYTVVWIRLQPLVDFKETSNDWTFIIVFVTCSITILIGLIIVIFHHLRCKLTWRHTIWFDLILLLCWIEMLLVGFGAKEEMEDRSKCAELGINCTKSFVPKIPTKFGIYISGVCGTSNTETDNPAMTSQLVKNPQKCAACRSLQTSIQYMYTWTLDMVLVSLSRMCIGGYIWVNYGNSKKRTDELIAFSN